jgi:signal transduction histidine kinase
MIGGMINPDSTDQINWLVVILRWITLMGAAIALAFGDTFPLAILFVLSAAALWSGLLTLFAAFKQRKPLHPLIITTIDTGIAGLLFLLSGGLSGNLVWIGLLPLASAALYYQMRGFLFISLVQVLIQSLIALVIAPSPYVFLFIVLLLPLYMGIGFFYTFISERIRLRLVNSHKETHLVQKKSEQKERERRHIIYKLISGMSASLTYQRVLESALDLSNDALSTENGLANQLVSAVLLFVEGAENGTELEIGSARRFTPHDLQLRFPGKSGLIGGAIDEGKARLSQNVAGDPELKPVLALQECRSAYCIPLRAGLDTWGVLLFAHPEPAFFSDERREILDIVGNQATIAIENARLYQDLEMEKERMIEIQEEARKKMARDLHDGPTQSVSSIAMRVNFARRLMERDPKATAEELYKIEQLARHTVKEIRHMLFTLRPLVLESQGLISALESMAQKMHETYDQKVIIQADPRVVEQMEMGKQGVVFSIAEEAVNNARKHANADHIWVRLKLIQEDLVLLDIEDDGVGFNVSEVDQSYENRGSLGMVNMRERSELVNGLIHLDSELGKGTRVQVVIPLSEAAIDRIRRGV